MRNNQLTVVSVGLLLAESEERHLCSHSDLETANKPANKQTNNHLESRIKANRKTRHNHRNNFEKKMQLAMRNVSRFFEMDAFLSSSVLSIFLLLFDIVASNQTRLINVNQSILFEERTLLITVLSTRNHEPDSPFAPLQRRQISLKLNQ